MGHRQDSSIKMIKLKDILTEGNKFDDVYKDYGFEVEKKSGGLTYWAHYGSDISGHKNSYIRGELSGWTDGKKAAVGDDTGRKSFSNPKKMAKWFEKNFKMKKESIHEGYQWHKLDMTSKEEDFMDGLEYELEKVFPGKDKKINDFIVSVFDVYDQPQSHISDIVRSGGQAKLVKQAKRTGLKPLNRAI